MRRRRLRLALAVLVPLAGGALLLSSFDAGALKPRIAAAVRRATGRDLVLSGPLLLRLLPAPTLEAQDVALGPAPDDGQPALATVRRLRLRLALLPLLRGAVVVERLALDRPDVHLETDAGARANGHLERTALAPSGAPGSGGHARPILVRHVDVTDGTLAWREAGTGRSASLAVPDLSIRQDAPGGVVTIRGMVTGGGFTGRVAARVEPTAGQAHLDVQGTMAGQAVSLLADAAPPAIDVTARAGAASLTLSGQIARPLALAGLDLRVSAQVPDPAALPGGRMGLAGPLALDARVTGDARGALALGGISLRGPAGTLAGDLAIAPGAVPKLRGALTSDRLDLDALTLAPADKGAAPAGPLALLPPRERRLIPDLKLPLDRLRDADADLRLAIATLVRGGATVGALRAHLVLTDGRLALDPVTADLAGGRVQARLAVGASAPNPVSLHLLAQGMAAGTVLTWLRLPPVADGALDVLADLRGAGASLRALAAGLDGSASIAMAQGTLAGAALRPVLAGAWRAAGLPPDVIALDGDSEIRCLAARLTFTAGHGTLGPLLLDTSHLRVEGDGAVNLADETLMLNLRPLARLGATGVAVPVRIDGTLAAPRGRIDTGSLASAVVGGGFRAIVGALDAAATGASCAPALSLARNPAAEPQNVPAGARPPTPLDLLKKLFR